MKPFSALDPLSPLEGPCFLEASAGTGKTFAVEQIVARLILEKEIELERILVITFTKAATRELKERIRLNLAKALEQLQSGAAEWGYLKALFPSPEKGMYRLQEALRGFDRSQIFTIHGFCHRMLKEFAFETNCCLSKKTPDEPQIQISQKLKQGVFDFLLSLSENILCPEQMQILLKTCRGIEALVLKLARTSLKKQIPATPNYTFFYQTYVKTPCPFSFSVDQVLQDFRLIAKHYKAKVKGRFEEQIRALLSPPSSEAFRFLLAEEGSLFDFLSLENRKVKGEVPLTLSDPFFAWGKEHIYPLIQEAMHPQKLFSCLSYEWSLAGRRLMQKEELIDPDAILEIMREKIEDAHFVKLIQNKYQAALIDEFQDTDLLQWDIFKTLFISPERPSFLVGDPKQSIYRFRKADIYTYIEAKNSLPSSCHYVLDTNFRSTPSLLKALNLLFEKKSWLRLPQLGSFLPYHPVQAGLSHDFSFSDGKGALHFILLEAPMVRGKQVLELSLCPFLVQEIVKLKQEGHFEWGDFAILVKDRYAASCIVRYLEEKGIPAAAKNHLPLGETFAFQALKELFDALIDPKDWMNKARWILAGPLGRVQKEEMRSEIPTVFFELKECLEQGLVRFFQKLLQARLHTYTVLEAIALEDAAFYANFFHTVELLLAWEGKEGFSMEGLKHFLQKLRFLEPEEDERARQRVQNDEEAVQIMTMHVSKGLEFPIVFALGLAAQTPKPIEDGEELEAEKLRQLYVAMTRAKKRLYVPAFLKKMEKDKEGASPIELFFHHLLEEKSAEEFLEKLSKEASITWQTLGSTSETVLEASSNANYVPPPFCPPRLQVEERYIHSFTSLSSASHLIQSEEKILSEEKTIHTLPRGKETGILLHELLEDLFSSPHPLWREEEQIKKLVFEKMKDTKFSEWTAVVQDLLIKTAAFPFLYSLEPNDVSVEMEFLFEEGAHMIKGFVDLLFKQGNCLYLLDWKSNWLGSNDEAYHYSALKQCMKDSDYELQAILYAEALKRSFPNMEFGGAYYVFLRGVYCSASQGILYFEPKKLCQIE